MNSLSPGSQSIAPVVGPAHEIYPGMHGPADPSMGHVAGTILVISIPSASKGKLVSRYAAGFFFFRILVASFVA